MAREQEAPHLFVRSLHLDLATKELTIQATDESATRLTLAPQGIIYEYLPAGTLPTGQPTELPQRSPETAVSEATSEKERAISVAGKLKSPPKEGRPDSSGAPTAWARFAAHEEADDGRSRAHLYIASFHGATRETALGLPVETQLEVKGFSHAAKEQGKLDSLSVVDITRVGEQQIRMK